MKSCISIKKLLQNSNLASKSLSNPLALSINYTRSLALRWAEPNWKQSSKRPKIIEGQSRDRSRVVALIQSKTQRSTRSKI